MPTFPVEITPNLESAAPKKKTKLSSLSCHKPSSGAAGSKKPLRSAGSTAARIPPKAEVPGVERITRHNKPPPLPGSQDTRIAAAKVPPQADEQQDERITKRERMLTLLSRPEGANIQEMMQATGWQQHSVRGFLAGTVKRKLGFSLTSFKPDDGVRRYRIEKRRGR